MVDIALPVGFLIIAVLIFAGINKGLNLLFRMLPDSSFRSFMVSTSGSVLTVFVSLLLLFVVIVVVAINSGIQC